MHVALDYCCRLTASFAHSIFAVTIRPSKAVLHISVPPVRIGLRQHILSTICFLLSLSDSLSLSHLSDISVVYLLNLLEPGEDPIKRMKAAQLQSRKAIGQRSRIATLSTTPPCCWEVALAFVQSVYVDRHCWQRVPRTMRLT